jgi:aminopeptidase N
MKVVDVDAIHAVRQFVRHALAQQLRSLFLRTYQSLCTEQPYEIDRESVAKRALKNLCLNYLMLLNEPSLRALCLQQFKTANNMTDKLSALSAFAHVDCIERETVLAEFYAQWQHETLVVDKWLAVQARSELAGNLSRVKALLQHVTFDIKNPNKVRALVGVFCHDNLVQFHATDGYAYQFLADIVLQLDKLNPQTASRLIVPLTHWQRYDAKRQSLMTAQLKRIMQEPGLSKDVYEMTTKSLNNVIIA